MHGNRRLIHLMNFLSLTAVMVAADKALSALNRIRAGIKADKRVTDRQKRAKKEVSSLFRGGPSAKKAKAEKWHGAISLSCLPRSRQESYKRL